MHRSHLFNFFNMNECNSAYKRKEKPTMRTVPAARSARSAPPAAPKPKSGYLTLIFLIASVIMCIYGAATGDMEAVFIKAVNICMECIGLG